VGSFESENLPVEMHPNVLLLQKALENFVSKQVRDFSNGYSRSLKIA
jgi:hypothetical protein